MLYRKKIFLLMLLFVCFPVLVNATCICNSTVTQEFNRIKNKIDDYYDDLDDSLDKLKDQTDKLTEQQKKELPAVQAALNNYLIHYENEFKKTKQIEDNNEALSVLIEQMQLKLKTALSGLDMKTYKQVSEMKKDINKRIKKINDPGANYVER